MDILLSSPGIFFAVGLLLSRLNKHVHLPKEMLRFLSIYLVISIGLKGGNELRHLEAVLAAKAVGFGVVLGLLHGAVLFYGLKFFFGLRSEDATSLAAHYGSVSVGTFMVAVTFLKVEGIQFESELYLFLVAMECPAILMALALHQVHQTPAGFHSPTILRKVFYHETIVALLFGLVVGAAANMTFLDSLKPFYGDLFVGILTFFMLSMGMEAGHYWDQIKDVGLKFVWLGVAMQLLGAVIGLAAGIAFGFSAGGTTLLMILMGSASYIAAPCVMRESLPNANNSAVFLLSLGITFPINVLLGIKGYLFIAQYILG
jgi:uncharacterized protein